MSDQNMDNAVAAEQEMYVEDLTEQRKIRRQKLKDLQEAGRNPYLQETWNVTAYSKDIKDNFDAMEDCDVSMAGRIMSKRVMGKASFFDIQDKQGRIQCYIKRDDIGQEEYKWFKTYDIGDIVGFTGKVFRTRRKCMMTITGCSWSTASGTVRSARSARSARCARRAHRMCRMKSERREAVLCREAAFWSMSWALFSVGCSGWRRDGSSVSGFKRR